MAKVTRRAFLQGAGAAVATLAVPACEQPAQETGTQRRSYTFLSSTEADFLEPAVDRLIPADELGPGALAAGVPTFIDRQLAGPWGSGEGLYRSGPWQRGHPGQGYQLPFTPAELFRTSLRAIAADLDERGTSRFGDLAVHDQDAYLHRLEDGELDLDGVPSDTFFGYLLRLTTEGFFSDPIYGGNRGMVGWKMVGFPGAYANYYEFVDQHGVEFRRPPVSLGEASAAHLELVQIQPAPRTPTGG